MKIVFKRILLPVDLTDRHEKALAAAIDLVRQSNGDVILLHVIETIAGLRFDDERDFYNRLEKVARKHLEQLGEVLTRNQIRWQTEIHYGNRVTQVLEFAKSDQVDLIMLTSPRLDPEDPATSWGSLSLKIGLLCACPVLLVK